MKTIRNLFIIAAIMGLVTSCGDRSSHLEYPVTEKIVVTDTIFGKVIEDPYRWLEDDRSVETGDWVRRQNEVTFGYLDQIPYRDQLRSRLTEIWNFERFGSPFFEGGYRWFTRNDGLQNQFVLYRQKGDEEPEVFLDPNSFSADGTTSLAALGFSKGGSLMAYAISEGGSDWRKIITLDYHTGEMKGDTLTDIKFSGISWQGTEGFYYSSYEKPDGSELSAVTDHHKLYFHRAGTAQSEDKVVFGDDIVRRYVGGSVTEDGRYLVVSAAVSTSGNELYIKDLTRPDSRFITIVNNFENDHYLLDNDGSKLFIATSLNAPNMRVVTVDASNPVPDNWVDFIPETEHVLSPSTAGGQFFARYMVDAISKVKQIDRNGNIVREIDLPGPGSAGGFSGKKDDPAIYYTFTNYITPATILSFNDEDGTSEIFRQPDVDFNSDDYISEQVFYNSADGTRIPMIITRKKGTTLNGRNPTLLYGYGGFNVSVTPSFSVSNALWLELGGIYAVPNIRGGGEYGEKWHLAGTRMNRQNVFDDFIAAAEFLIEKGYTSSSHLAIRGGSNGGLLVGAVITQRPDLVRVALPAVGVLDMLRYHKFTAGAGWAFDYGTADDSPEMLEYLLKYSPVHNVREASYPATLITTADHDDRVVPAHSFKFAAHLQDKQQGNLPVLIRIETMAGHGAGMPVSKQIDQAVDIMAFTLWNMGIKRVR